MTFEELDAALPNGLHDAELGSLTVDWTRQTAEFTLVVWVGQLADSRGSEWYRPAVVRFSGLRSLQVDGPPRGDAAHVAKKGLWIDAGSGDPPRTDAGPELGTDVFKVWMFVHAWNAFIRLAASDVELRWTAEEFSRSLQ